MENMYFKDTRAQSGYGTILFVRDPASTDGLYEMLLPLESVASVFSDKETFDVNLLNVSTKSLIDGKYDATQTDNDFLWHRDNIIRLNQFNDGQVYDFLVAYGDWTGYSFAAKISYKPGDAEADKLNGTLSLTPVSINTDIIIDCRDLVKNTCTFASSVPDSVKLSSANSRTTTVTVTTLPSDAELTFSTDNATFSASVSDSNIAVSGEVSGEKTIVTLTGTAPSSGSAYGIVYIKASKDGYASWTTSISYEVAAD